MWGRLRKWLRGAQPLGDHGEALAAAFLRRQGYRVLHRNARLGRYEVDIIAEEADTIAFVEVKTRQTADTFRPEDSIGAQKMEHLRRAARVYESRLNNPNQQFRFDVVSIVLVPGEEPEITLLRNAF